ISRAVNCRDATWARTPAMNDTTIRRTGGCLCGALRYEAKGEPLFTGHCYCVDCQKASGSGFIPYMGFASGKVHFSGPSRRFASKAASGRTAVRNYCPTCGSLVFGGEIGKSDSFTIYAGTLDDPSSFHPTAAIFASQRSPWAIIPPGLTVFDGLPPDDPGRR
ncbi:MAG: GFA family protein, partial [Stellaceae bacterium]